jgi:hypothetical protein
MDAMATTHQTECTSTVLEQHHSAAFTKRSAPSRAQTIKINLLLFGFVFKKSGWLILLIRYDSIRFAFLKHLNDPPFSPIMLNESAT